MELLISEQGRPDAEDRLEGLIELPTVPTQGDQIVVLARDTDPVILEVVAVQYINVPFGGVVTSATLEIRLAVKRVEQGSSVWPN